MILMFLLFIIYSYSYLFKFPVPFFFFLTDNTFYYHLLKFTDTLLSFDDNAKCIIVS